MTATKHGDLFYAILEKNDFDAINKWTSITEVLSTRKIIGAFDPCSAAWDVLPVKPWACPAFYRQIDFRSKNVSLMEHNGNIFVTENKSSVFKPNLERMVWEEKSEVSGLTIFARYPDSFSGSKRDTKYPSTNELLSQYYSLVDEKSSCPFTSTSLSKRVAWRKVTKTCE
ncbi:hypothetical protein YC2023_088819 [Brassica napus]